LFTDLWQLQLEDSLRAQPNPDIYPPNLPLDVNIQHFLRRLQIGDEWGGTETLVAIASMENVRINVYFEGDTDMEVQEILPRGEESVCVRQISIVYTGNHYDAILKFI
jgi:hypothetical protein